MRKILVLVTMLAMVFTFSGTAFAQEKPPVRHAPEDPPETEFVVGGAAHTHHVFTGDGCKDIDAVLFVIAPNGLHQGSNASSFGNPNDPDLTRGPFHGTCDGRFFPGGPLIPE